MSYTFTRIKFRWLNLITGIAVLTLLSGSIYAKTLSRHTKGVNSVTQHSALPLLTPTITFSPALASRQYGSADFIPATSNSNTTLIFSSDNPAVATIVNNKVHVNGVGTCTITATQAANAQYEAATAAAALTVVKATPVITFINGFTTRVFSNTAFTPATVTLKAPVTYTSDNPDVAIIVNNQVKMVGAGTANITATVSDDTNYNQTQSTAELTVSKAAPVITFVNNFSPRTYRTTDFTAANATLGATVVYSSDNPAVATILNGKVNMVGAGTVNITATVVEDNRYTGTTVSQQLVVEKAAPVINFASNFSPRVYTTTDFVAATATLGATVTLSSDNFAVATTVNNLVNMVGAGTTNITATIAEDDRYIGTTVTMPLTVTKADPVISFINNFSPRTFTTNNFTAATVTLGAPLILTSDNPAVATIVGGKVNLVAPGMANITAAVIESDKYIGKEVTMPLTVLKASPTITFVSNFSPRAYSATAFTPATANFGAPIVFTSDNAAVATIVNNQVKLVNPGTANITATIAESDQYEGKVVSMQLVVEKVSASINFVSGLNSRPFSTTDFIPANATQSAPLTFTSDNNAVATIVNNQVHLVGVGTATITATIPDNARYVGKTATSTMTVVQSTPVINFATLNPRAFNTSDFIPATVTLGAPVTFTSDNPAVATIVNGRVNMISVGTANITATVAGSDKFVGTTSTATLNVVKATPVITFVNNFSPRRYGSGNFAPASANYGASVVYRSDNSAVAQIENNQVRLVSIGTANITASVTDNDVYNGVSLTRELTITQAQQSITFAAIPNKTFVSPPFPLSGTTNSGLPVIFTSSDENIAKIDGNNVVITGIGTVSITASQLGNTNYAPAADVVRTFTVSQVPQTINFAVLTDKNYGDLPFPLTGNATSGLPVTYVSSNPAVATVSGNTLTIVGGGATDITAIQAGNTAYAPAAPITHTFTVNKINQTITFNALTGQTYGNQPYTLTATASSGLPVIFTSSDTTVAKVSGNKLTIISGGPVNITASQPGDNNYNAAQNVTQSLSIEKANQTITFATLTDKHYADPDFILPGSSSSGLPLNYTSSNPAVATVNGNIVTITGVGVTTITASQAGNINYYAATSVPQQLTVNKANQTISFTALIAKAYADPDFLLTASATSGLPVTYTSSNPAVATVTGSTVTIVGIGSTTITATQPGNENYNAAATVTQTLIVGKANQTIAFAPLPGKTFNDLAFKLTATASSGLPVVYASSNPAVATVSGNTVTIIGTGTTNITATQSGNANYYAAVNIVQPLNVGKAVQAISFATIPLKTYGDEPFDVHANSTSGLPITFISSNPAVATVTDSTITIIGAGTATITALQNGDANYQAATPLARILTVNKANQAITFAALPGKTMGDADFDLTATASSGLPVSFTSSNNQVATINTNTITIKGVGATIITASQPGNANYNPATEVLQIQSVGKADQTINFAALPDKAVGEDPFLLTATATSGLPIVYTSSNPAIASISGNTVTILKAGVVIITAAQNGNTNYNAAPSVFQLLTIGKGNQTITFAAIADKIVGAPSFNANATASSGLAVQYTSSNNNVATISNTGQIAIIGEGNVTITASQPGNANYFAANTVSQSFTVSLAPPVKLNQTITFANIADKTLGDPDFDLSATASSGLAVVFTSSNNNVATVSGTTVHIVGPGTVTITASQPGNATFNPALIETQTFAVNPASVPEKANQTITFAAINNKVLGDPDFNAGASASSGLPVSYVSSNELVATVSSTGVIHIVGEGTVTITASQSGNTTYNAAPNAARTFTVSATSSVKLNQTITFAAITDKVISDPDFNAGASASSGLPVSYVSSNELVATVSSTGVIHIVGEGTVTITASQSGNTIYNAAPNVSRIFTVNAVPPVKLNQTITFAAIANKVISDADFNAGASASSGLPILYMSSNELVATVSSAGLIHIVGEGTVSITASQPGNSIYSAATPITQSFVVETTTLPTKNDQLIIFASISNKTFGDSPFTPAATATSGLPVILNSNNSAVATINGNVITIVGVGDVTITASQPGNATYNPAPVVLQSFTVKPATPDKLIQTITFAPISNKTVGDPDFTISASINSALPIVFTSSNTAVATVSGNTVHIVDAGNITITASQAGNATYNPATATQSFLVSPAPVTSKIDQVLTFAPISNKTVGDPDFTISASNNSGLPIVFSSSDLNVATVSGNNVHIVGQGNVTITASQPGNATYNPAFASQPFVVSPAPVTGKIDQVITFAPILNKTVGDPNFTVSASTNSGLPIVFTSSNTAVATVSGNTVHIVGAGNVVITASQAGNATYNPVTATQSFVVSPAPANGKIDQVITFVPISNKTVGDPDFTISASTNSGLPIVFSSSDLNVATVNGNNVHIVRQGNVTITASQAGDVTYNAATATQSFVVSPAPVTGKIDQVLTFSPILNKTVGDPDFTVFASTNANLPIVFTSSNTAVATVSDNTVHIVGQGNVTITASQAGNATYNAGSATQSFVVSPAPVTGKIDQVLTFTPISNKTVGDPDFTISASTNSGLPIIFSSSDLNVATVNGNNVHIVGQGNVTITASQAGNASYNAATATQSFVVSPAPVTGKIDQVITFVPIPNKVVGDPDFTVSASTNANLPIVFTSSNTAVATVSGNNVHIVAAGNVTITASQVGNATYNPATATQSFAVSPASTPSKLNQTITFATIGNKSVGDAPFALSATASSSLPVTFWSSDPSVASVNGNIVTIIKAGNVTITASQNGDATYNATTAIQSFVVNTQSSGTKTNQSITFASITDKLTTDAPFNAGATASSGLTVLYSSSDNNVATVSPAGLISIVGAGNVIITASQPGDAVYNPALSVPRSFTVNTPISGSKTNQSITFAPITDKLTTDAPFNAGATASSGLTVQYSSSDDNVATVSTTGLITMVGAGNVTITASQPGDAVYNPAPSVPRSFAVITPVSGSKTNQSITFAPITDKLTTDAPFNAGATASSGLTVLYSSSDDNVATVSPAGLITMVGAGNVTITASQPGDAVYNPAASVSRSFTVGVPKLNQTIAFAALTARTYGNATFQLSATASSGLPITYTSSNPDVATISGNTVTIMAAGNVTITASQTGNATYNPASAAAQNLLVNKASLLVQATDANRAYGTANPTFVMNYSGFVNGDTQASLQTMPTVNTVATLTASPGNYPLVASGGISNNYAFTYSNGTLTITPALAIITFSTLPVKTYGDADFNPGATSNVNEPVQYSSSNTAVATIVNGNIHITGAGTAIITALYPSTSGFSLTQPQTQLLVVNKAQQTITFTAIPPIAKGETYALQNVTASSGLPVSITIADQNIVTLQGTTLTGRQLGATAITLSQPGNNNYLPATPITIPVEVVNTLGKPEIEIHKAVSPNGDGINDFLFIEGITKFQVHMVTIYNRNGIKVWETTHYDNTSTRFEGRSNVNGQLQSGGTYFYVIQFMNNGVGRRIEGAFVLKYQ